MNTSLRWLSLCLGLLCLPTVLPACGDEGEDPPPTSYPIPPDRPPNETCLAPEPPLPTGKFQLTGVFDDVGSSLDRAVKVVQHPDDPSIWYAALQGGRVIAFSSDGRVETFADLSDRLWLGHHEAGLVNVALAPDYGTSGVMYVIYSAPQGAGFVSRLARLRADDDFAATSDEPEVVLDIPQVYGAHVVNDAIFGPDGMMYVAVGDDLSYATGTPDAQNPNTLKGAILRIDPSTQPYAIPPDNPFVDGGGAPEVYAFGLRNPFRLSFDRETGELWAGDVGQDTVEEIDIIVAGGNYGWPYKEGTSCFSDPFFAGENCDDPNLIDPVAEYFHTGVASVTAGYVYRGTRIPELVGRFVWADFASGVMYSTAPDAEGNFTSAEVELEPGINVSAFAEDHDGELYVLRYSAEGEGGLYRIDPVEQREDTFPRLLSQTGCVDPEDPTKIVQGVHPYTIRAQLWSDGADKRRFLAIPDDQRITVRGDGDFELPRGTVLMKHFLLDERYVETRLLIHHDDGTWAGYSYEWNEEQTDADLLDWGKTVRLSESQSWTFPTRSQCAQCHTDAARHALGPEVLQLDWDPGDHEGVEGNLLAYLLDIEAFVPGIEDVSDLPVSGAAMPDPFGSGPLEDRARAYLHANCAGCHRPGGLARGDVDLRYRTSMADTRTCQQPPDEQSLGGGYIYLDPAEVPYLITPGDAEASILYRRMTTLNVFRMPPLGTHVVDERGAALVAEWIDEMEGCQ